jgi:hypothetical protein
MSGLSVMASTAGTTHPTAPLPVANALLARMIGPKLAETWGQQVVVDN